MKHEKYYLYVHGYLIPWLSQQRVNGKLKHGKWFLKLNFYVSGELAKIFVNDFSGDNNEFSYCGEFLKKNDTQEY